MMTPMFSTAFSFPSVKTILSGWHSAATIRPAKAVMPAPSSITLFPATMNQIIFWRSGFFNTFMVVDVSNVVGYRYVEVFFPEALSFLCFQKLEFWRFGSRGLLYLLCFVKNLFKMHQTQHIFSAHANIITSVYAHLQQKCWNKMNFLIHVTASNHFMYTHYEI